MNYGDVLPLEKLPTVAKEQRLVIVSWTEILYIFIFLFFIIYGSVLLSAGHRCVIVPFRSLRQAHRPTALADSGPFLNSSLHYLPYKVMPTTF